MEPHGEVRSEPRRLPRGRGRGLTARARDYKRRLGLEGHGTVYAGSTDWPFEGEPTPQGFFIEKREEEEEEEGKAEKGSLQ